MGLFKRLRQRTWAPSKPDTTVAVTVYSGDVDLEVVGESHYQENLSKVAAVDSEPVALLLPEPRNPYDPNAVAIWVPIPTDPEHQELLLVGYLPRRLAADYQSEIIQMEESSGKRVALQARIVGGYEGKSFGIRLAHDPADFGMPTRTHTAPGSSVHSGPSVSEEWDVAETGEGTSRSRTLYDRWHDETRIILWTERNKAGEFVIAGQDLGEAPMRMFGDLDFEYWYSFDTDQERLLESRLRDYLVSSWLDEIPDEAGAEDLLGLAFSSGLFEAPAALSHFLSDNTIEYEYVFYA